MKKLVVVGAGGHARSVLDIALQNNDFDIVGSVDPKPGSVLGIPVIGTDKDLEELYKKGIQNIFIAIGDNLLRQKLFNQAVDIGFNPVNIIHKSAVISPRTTLGNGICVMAGAIINVNTVIEDNCIINTNCSIDHDCLIKRSSHVAPGATISGTVNIGEGVHLGTGVSIIDGITIGDWSYIGGGAAVVNDIPSRVMAFGVPAKVIREI